MAAERQSMPDLRNIPPETESKDDGRYHMTKSMSCLNEEKVENDDDIEENLDNSFGTQVKPKPKKKRSWKSKRKIHVIESPRAEIKKEKVSLRKRFKRLLTPKRIKTSFTLPTPQVVDSLNVNAKAEPSDKLLKGQDEYIKEHGTIHVKPVRDETEGPTEERICDCDRVKQLETEILQLKNENSTKEREMLNTIEKKNDVISEMKNSLTKLAQDARYVNLSGCKNMQICVGGSDPKELLEPVRCMLEGLCKNNEKVKKIAMDISERVDEMQNSSTEDRSQQKDDMIQLKELVEQMMSKTQDDVSEDPSDPVLQPKYSKPRDTVLSRPHSSVDSGNCVVWGRSNVINDVSIGLHDIINRLMKIEESQERTEMISEKVSVFVDLLDKFQSSLADNGKYYKKKNSKLTGHASF